MSSSLCLMSLASNSGGLPASSIAWIVQYSCATNARIASSRSTISRNATVCTRPADSPRRTLFHSRGEILYPTSRSSTRRACCASTRLVSRPLGCSKAARMALGVISLKVTRKIFLRSAGGMSVASFSSLAARLAALEFASSLASAPLPFCLPGASASTNRLGFESTIAKCAEMASPSRSGSGAK